MKRLLAILVLVSLLMASGAYAKSITYVSDPSTIDCYGDDCSCYSELGNTEDAMFCEELTDLGYEVFKVTENDVATNSIFWQEYKIQSDMIFVGDVSSLILTGSFHTSFCTNLEAAINTTTKMFSTGLNNYYELGNIIPGGGYGTGFTGCAFDYATYSGTPNTCSGIFLINTPSVMTQGMTERLDIYMESTNVNIFNANGGYVTVRCDPSGSPPTWGYPVFDILQDKVVFWGFNDPTKYTDNAWELFDRAVLFSMGDDVSTEITGTLQTNKNSYKPTEIINITFSTESLVTGSNIILKYPDNTQVSLGPMDPHLNLNYSIGKNAMNGTYTILATVTAPGVTSVFTKSVDIIPYTLSMSANNYSYAPGSQATINITVGNVYSTELNITANITVVDPNLAEANLFYGKISNIFGKTYDISANAVSGKYKVKIRLNDSDSRTISKDLEFMVKTSGNLTIKPSIWNMQAPASGTYTQLFILNNTGATNITEITITPSIGMTADKASISVIEPNKTDNFTASVYIANSNYTGTITVSSPTTESVINVDIKFSSQAITNGLEVSPSSITVITAPDKKVTKTINIDNVAVVSATSIGFTISGEVERALDITDIPTTIQPDDSDSLIAEFDTTGLEEGTYSGTLTIRSSVGNSSVFTTLIVVGDLSVQAGNSLADLTALKVRIDSLRKKDTTSLVSSYESIKTALEGVKSDYEDEEYETAYNSLQQAQTDMSSLESDIEYLENEKPAYGGIIWTMAAIVILGIIGVVAYRYRWKFKEIYYRIRRKRGKAPEESEEYAPTEGNYRTEYY